MTRTLQESHLYRWYRTARATYFESGLYRGLASAAGTCAAVCAESRTAAILGREGVLASQWGESALCRALTGLFTLPGRLLHAWYTAWRALFEDSFFARLAFALGEETAIAESWLVAVLWVIPFIYWNNAYSLTAFAFLLLLFHAGAMRRRSFRLDLADVGFYPLVFFCAVALNVPMSYRTDLSLRFFGYHLAAALCVLVTVSAVRDAEDLRRLAAGSTACAAVSAVYGIFQRMQGVEVNIAYVDAKLNPDMPGRVQSYFDNPNTYAEFLVMLLPLTLALALSSRTKAGRGAALGAWLAGVAALLMTYSRAAWVGFALSVGLTALFLRPAVLPVLAALCLAAVPLLPSAVLTRILTITNFQDTTTSSRFPLYNAAVRVIQRSPVFGAGLGADAVKKYIADYRLYKGAAPFVHAHNLYLETWLETGLLGVVGLIASLLWNIKRSFRAVTRCPDASARVLTCGAAAGLCGIALCGMADFPWHYPRIQCVFWYLFAMALAGTKVCRGVPRR